MDRDEMERITADVKVIADRIRILHDAGAERSEIARFLDKKYQHVHNVLKRSNRLAGAPEPSVPVDTGGDIHSVTIAAGNRIALPASWLQNQGLAEGSVLICREEDGSLRIMSRAAASAVLRGLARQRMPDQAALLDALLGPDTGKPS